MDLFALILLVQLQQQPVLGCTEIDKMLDHLLAKYGESPSGQANLPTGPGVIITRNQESNEGSVLIQDRNNPSKWCIVFGLKNFRPVQLPKPGKPT